MILVGERRLREATWDVLSRGMTVADGVVKRGMRMIRVVWFGQLSGS